MGRLSMQSTLRLPQLKGALEDNGVEIRGCEKTVELIDAKPAKKQSTKLFNEIVSVYFHAIELLRYEFTNSVLSNTRRIA